MLHFKKILAVLAVSCLGVFGLQAQVEWLNTTYDFGAFGENEQVSPATFRFVNKGAEPICIVSASATCGCTKPEYSTDAIQPGDTATVMATYNPEGRPGRFNKQVYVRLSSSPERIKLTLKGVVIGNAGTVSKRYPVEMGPLHLRNGVMMMGRLASNKSKSEFMDGYNASAQPITPVFENVPRYLSVQATPAEVPPGEMVSLSFFFMPDRCQLWGLVTDSITIYPTGKGGPSFQLPFTAIVEEDFSSLTPEQRLRAPILALMGDRIDLGAIPVNSQRPVKAKIEFANQGKEPLKLRRVYTQDPAIKIVSYSPTVKPGKSGSIVIEYDPSNLPSGLVNTRLSVISNDPSAPTRTVRIVGDRCN